MHYFRPVKTLKKIADYIWRILAARLRLTSYMFGGRHQAEEFSHAQWPWSRFRSAKPSPGPQLVRDGTFRRVPATDDIALPREMRATAQVTEDGVPVDEEARVLIAAQNAEAEKAKRPIKGDYTVVYIPPHFRQRLIAFIGVLWLIGATSLAFFLITPMLLGRAVFSIMLGREVHDGYSFIVGVYLFWACYAFGKAIDRMDKRRQRRGGDGPRAELAFYVAKRSLLWSVKISYMVLFLGIVVPTLIAIVVELYLLMPIRYFFNSQTTARIRLVDMWCLGILYTKISIHANQLRPPNRITSGLQTVCRVSFIIPLRST